MAKQFPQALAPCDPPTRPSFGVPDGAWDAHVHLLAGRDEFPLWDGRVEDPAAGHDLDDWLDIFRRHLRTLGLSRGVIVHSILYGDDNSVTLEALLRLGPDFSGVGLVRDGASADDLDRLADAGCRAIRLNYVHGGVLSWQGALDLAPMLADRGMHIQMLMNANKHMTELEPGVRRCPVPVVFDHLGWPDLGAGIAEPGFDTLRGLVADGAAYVKLSAPYRLCPSPYSAADAHIAALAMANPDHCLWGSDWPHLMLADATQPDAGKLFDAFARAVPDPETRHRILVDTPTNLFAS
jgi:predicted TIM-barrel fold metal-dependent hydrolase